MLRIWLGVLVLSVTVSCRSKPTEPTVESATKNEVVDRGCSGAEGETCHQAQPSVAKQPALGTQLYGSPLGSSEAVELSEVLSNPEKFHDRNVVVSGYVKRACSRKGCWMELSTNAEKNSVGCRVKFKDYGFFVPTDAQGSSARLEGLVQVTKVEKAAVEHYESEGGTFPSKAADGTAKEVRFVATGVELTRG